MPPVVSRHDRGRPFRRRRRPAVACRECRRRKVACDKKLPCAQCALHGEPCVYGTTANEPNGFVSEMGSPRDHCTVPSGDSDGRSFLRPPLTPPGCQHLRRSTHGPPDNTGGDGEDINYSPDKGAQTSHNLGVAMPHLKGRLSKTRLLGQSHWMNNMVEQFKDTHSSGFRVFFDTKSDLYTMLQRCKCIARALKARQLEDIQSPGPPDLRDLALLIPPKEVSDELVGNYLRTFESVFRILHIPTFQKECSDFWSGSTPAKEIFMTKFVLTMAIGSCIYNGGDEVRMSLRIAAAWAIRNTDAWQCGTVNKHRLNLDTIQIYCLVLLARQTSAVEFGDDLVWISAGSLLRTSFIMGLHRDPTLFQDLSLYQVEMRRRLWATVLELGVQSSLDSGMPPLIHPEDYDCRPPSNINDDEMVQDDWATSAFARPDSAFTQTSCQRILLQSLPTRLQVTKLLNGVGTAQTYDETLRLSQELTKSCRFESTSFEPVTEAGVKRQQRPHPSPFQEMLVNLLTRRFIHSLHSPFATKALADVRFYYSRRMHLESAFELISILATDYSEKRLGADDLHTLNLIQVTGRGFFKCILLDSGQTVCFELLQQLRERYLPSALGMQMTMPQRELYQAVKSLADVGWRRLEGGETSVKLYIFYSGVLAQADAILAGRDNHESILDATRRSLHKCEEILLSRAVRAGIPSAEYKQLSNEQGASSGGSDVIGPNRPIEPDTSVATLIDIDHWVEFYLQSLGVDFNVELFSGEAMDG